MPQYSSAKQAINAKLSGNTAMGPKNVPGTTGAVGGVAKPTPSIFDTPAAAGATLDINKTKPYNSLEYGQNTANLYPGSQFLQQAASGNQVSSGGQTTTRGNQTGMSTGMQTGYNQFGSPQAIQSQGYQAYSPISQGLADYNLSQPSTSAGGKAVSDAYKQASTIKTGGDQILANQFANRDYQGLMDSQMAAKSAEAFYSNKAQQNQQIEKAIAQKQALDLRQQALTQSYEAKTALTKMQYQTKIKDTADSLNKAQAGILEAVGNDIVNLTALSDAKGHIMTGQMILDNLSQSRNIDLDQIANEYTNNIQSSVNTFLANNSRIGIAAAGMLKELEANGALDTAKGQMEASNILQTSYAAIGQSSQNLTQSLQYYNQVAQQLSQIAYQKASLEQNQRQFEISNQLERDKLDFQKEASNIETKIDNVTGVSTITNKKTGQWEMRDQEGNVISSGNFGGMDSGLTNSIAEYTKKYSGNDIKTGKECKVTSREFNTEVWDDPTRFGNTLEDTKKVLASAAKEGRVSSVPVVGSTAVFDIGTEWGHTATVFGVKDDGTLIVHDSNYGKATQPGKTGDGIARIHEMKPNSVVGYYLPPKLKQQMSGAQTTSTQTPSLYDKITSFITGGQPASGTTGTTNGTTITGKTKGGVELSGSALSAYQSKSITDSPMDKRVITELERKGVFNEGTGNKAFYLNSTKTRPAINNFIKGLEKWEQAKQIMKKNDDSPIGMFNNLKQMMGGYDRAWTWIKGKTGTGGDEFMNDFNTLTTILGQELASYMKEISGATVSNSERETLSKQIPNLETMNERQFDSNVKLYDESIERTKREIMSDWGFNSWDDVMEVMRRQGGAEGGSQDIDSLSDEIINNK